jgi:hypothetical protein
VKVLIVYFIAGALEDDQNKVLKRFQDARKGEYRGLTQKAVLPFFEGFAKQNLPQMRQKPYEYICLKANVRILSRNLKRHLYGF